ncbi:stimulated by retinoic acid gene 8 protein homolog [Scyliorhinus canicula]|uniref:stimulated by retinoic acid gene 8 protein homolog n=1 Tax=Scyliorhinus canicula TaxID=7830 RepID=UPI0018F3D865|nr:stimulated by retinoic acid gene 8 protein homolog [Scyliorhinus canicula]
MESSGDCTSPYTDASSSFLAMLQEVEPRVARRRLSQARHRAKLAGLFNHLRDTVCPQSKRTKRTTSKWQVLRKAKNYILDLERKLENLLKLKEAYHLEDGHPSNLEEIKEQYINYYKEHCDLASASLPGKTRMALWQWLREYRGHPAESDLKPVCSQSPVKSSADLIEFEGYLNFYKETVDLLVENRIVSMEQITLPIVSKAISHLWQEMSGEKKEAIFKKCSQRVCLSPGEQITLQIPMQMDCSVRDRALDSQGASGSSESNHDEMLFEDAFDLASGFLVKPELNTRTGIKRESSSIFTHCSSENPEETCILYKQIINFVMARPGTVAHHSQESSPNVDDETVLLRCTETFDDDL